MILDEPAAAFIAHVLSENLEPRSIEGMAPSLATSTHESRRLQCPYCKDHNLVCNATDTKARTTCTKQKLLCNFRSSQLLDPNLLRRYTLFG